MESLALVVAADDEGEDRELPVAQETYETLTKQQFDDAQWNASLQRARSDSDGLWGALAAQKDQLSEDEKALILYGVVRVCTADAEFQEDELLLLNRMARQLGAPVSQLRQAMSKVWQEIRER